MRTAIRVLFVTLLCAACTTANQPAELSNAESIRSLYNSFAKGDMPAVLGAFDPNIVWVQAENSNYADRNPYRGPQAVVEGVFTRLMQDWDNFRVNVEQVVDGGDTVVATGRYTATNKATGQPLNAQFVHVWSMQGGRILRFQQYVDTAQFARVSGMSK